MNTHKICTFIFRNNSKINVAVPYFDNNKIYDFHTMMAKARCLAYKSPNEEEDRGGLQSFEVGETIFV